LRSLQARGNPQEVAREVRALLNLVRDNEATIGNVSTWCGHILDHAREHLTILDPDVGDEELIKAVATELTRLDAFLSEKKLAGMG
jgi:hypothetical protein